MNRDDAIVLETFSNRIEAEMAAGLLESEGIEAMVMADDASGTFPPSSSSGGCTSWWPRKTRPGPKKSWPPWPRPGTPSANRKLLEHHPKTFTPSRVSHRQSPPPGEFDT